MPKDHRRIAIADFERKIKEHLIALGFIAEIPIGTVIHAIRPTFMKYKNDKGGEDRCWIDSGHLLYPFKINSGSFRCRVLGIEVAGHDADQLMKHDGAGKAYADVLRFLDIRSWHLYRPEDAGLYMNWAALSEEAKRLLYGREVFPRNFSGTPDQPCRA